MRIYLLNVKVPIYKDTFYSIITILQGLWRDNVLISLIFSINLALISFLGIINKNEIIKILIILLSFINILTLAIAFSNVRYYVEFEKTIDFSSFLLIFDSTISKMVIADFDCIILLLLFIVAVFICNSLLFLFYKQFKKEKNKSESKHDTIFILIVYLFWVALSLYTKPSNVNQARYSADPIYDRIAVCSPLYFFSSVMHYGDGLYEKAKPFVNLLSDEDFDGIVDKFDLGGNRKQNKIDSGHFFIEMSNKRPNIVLVLMEGMSAKLMDTFGCGLNLTPFLDSLYVNSFSFKNCYSAGQRTNNGIVGTFNSWPSILDKNAILSYAGMPSQGLPIHLKQLGYKNYCFVSHDLSFDGLDYYLPRNGFDSIYSINDYPKEEIVGPWGCNDDFLLSYASRKIKEIDKASFPYFATIMTISNHPPYKIPTNYVTSQKDQQFVAIEYSDYCLSKFYKDLNNNVMDNTMFIFIGDHGNIQQISECELPEQLNHIPLIISGSGLPPFEYSDMFSQMDLDPFLMEVLGESNTFNYNGFGFYDSNIPRKFVPYSSWTCFGCRSLNKLYVLNYEDNIESYYETSNNQCLPIEIDQEFSEMRDFCKMIFQKADLMSIPFRR